MPTMPQITVLIPTFNRADFLDECLRSLLTQSLPASQIIVIDDGSTDETKRVLAPYKEAIEYLKTDQEGKPGALNKGLDHTKGDYVWIFDDDDVAMPDALERFVKPLEENPEYGFSFSTFNFTDTAPDGSIGDVIEELRIPDLEKRGFLVPLMEWNFLGGAALFARTSCYHKVGKFDPDLIRSQDYEMAIRIARSFKGIRVPGGPTFHYRQHEGLRGAKKDRFRSQQRKSKWLEYDQIFFRKLYRDLPLQEYLPAGEDIEKNKRYAMLQRLAIMGEKLMVEELADSLDQLARLDNTSSFSKEEYDVVRKMTHSAPYHQEGHIIDYNEFIKAVGQKARSSKSVGEFKTKLMRAIWSRFKAEPSLKGFVRSVQCSLILR